MLAVKKEFNKIFSDVISQIGYIRKRGNYYSIDEIDGYCEIFYYSGIVEGEETIEFTKNFYTDRITGITKKDIRLDFYNCLDFEKFLLNHHKSKGRKIKLNKISTNENV